MYGMKRSELRLLPHDPAWSDDFITESNRIAAALLDASARIEHVGSTSIPRLHAKPILDIAILCGGAGLERVISALVGLGYEYRGRFGEKDGHYYAVLDAGDVRRCQAHIYTEENAGWRSKLRFRDVLRRNAELAREYDEYKLRLAKEVSGKSEYAEVKSRWVDTFILKFMSADSSEDDYGDAL
jgi:GrpB-like predicted nucleotidyltransferase (UPF0157 family)